MLIEAMEIKEISKGKGIWEISSEGKILNSVFVSLWSGTKGTELRD